MSNQPFVIWIDDEPNLMAAETYDLKNHEIDVREFQWIGDALQWMQDFEAEARMAKAMVIDLLMPTRGDPRFKSNFGDPAGVTFCQNVKLIESFWAVMRPRTYLYTRLPGASPAYERAKLFAQTEKIQFEQKSPASRIALDLIECGLLNDDNGDDA